MGPVTGAPFSPTTGHSDDFATTQFNDSKGDSKGAKAR